MGSYRSENPTATLSCPHSSWNLLSFPSRWCHPKYHWSFPRSPSFQPLELPSLPFCTVAELTFLTLNLLVAGKFSEAENPWAAWAATWRPGIHLSGSLTGSELCWLLHLCELQTSTPSLVLPPPPAEQPLWRGDNMPTSYTLLSLVSFPSLHFFLVPALLYVSAPFALSAFPSFW